MSFLLSPEFMDELYRRYLEEPSSVDPSWRSYFDGFEFGLGVQKKVAPADDRISRMITAFRRWGFLEAKVNPLVDEIQPAHELSLKTFGFQESELDRPFATNGLLPTPTAPLRAIHERLRTLYCNRIGLECEGIGDPIESWLTQKFEKGEFFNFTHDKRLLLLHHITKAEIFETFLHTKFVGQKRFSLEGEETLVPMLFFLLDQAAEAGVQEAVIGMAHRGRLNVLANLMGKSYAMIFREFEDYIDPALSESMGDVKYHRGFLGSLETLHGRVTMVLSANASHLESVDPIVEGIARAHQEKGRVVLPILMHGEAAFAGQGVVYETLQFMKLKDYATQGTVHIIINNQIGFTTQADEYSSMRSCTDLAKTFHAPVFHVSAEDPEACVAAAEIALQVRQQFQKDVFINLIGYRKYGHNEGDEPTFTQPLQYKKIRERKLIREIYKETLIAADLITEAEVSASEEEFKSGLQKAFQEIKNGAKAESKGTAAAPSPSLAALSLEELKKLQVKLTEIPQGFHIHPKLQKHLTEMRTAQKLNWGSAELLAYASLLIQGMPVRLAGQDTQRGTFSHRHAVWVDQENGERYFPLEQISQTHCAIVNSPLSEFASVGFEYGYNFGQEKGLTIWEAQYGDFANGAQVVIDQYIAAGEQKWSNASSLTLFLPHGYEGQGSEHSSARLERFLQLSAQDNLYVVNATTPAQLFHVLRRQAHLQKRRPLILFTPKVLLRHPDCVSPLEELAKGTFQAVIDEGKPSPRRLLLCSGKVYYDLIKKKKDDCALIRVEELYPFPREKLEALAKKYAGKREIFWVQEEPRNMGAWSYIRPYLEEIFGKVGYIGREASATPASGYHSVHEEEQKKLIERAFQ